nr:hypothetical protein GCM10020063_026070 [Dactylosporangium thailandense]
MPIDLRRLTAAALLTCALSACSSPPTLTGSARPAADTTSASPAVESPAPPPASASGKPAPAKSAKPTATRTTTAPATSGARVARVKLDVIKNLIVTCQPTVLIVINYEVAIGARGAATVKVQIHSTDGNDPAPYVHKIADGKGELITSTVSVPIKTDAQHLHRKVEFWAETLEPSRMTSARSTLSIVCNYFTP